MFFVLFFLSLLTSISKGAVMAVCTYACTFKIDSTKNNILFIHSPWCQLQTNSPIPSLKTSQQVSSTEKSPYVQSDNKIKGKNTHFPTLDSHTNLINNGVWQRDGAQLGGNWEPSKGLCVHRLLLVLINPAIGCVRLMLSTRQANADDESTI